MKIIDLVQKVLLEAKAIEVKSDNTLFTWTSGIKSPIYCDNRVLLSKPKAREEIVNLFIQKLQEEKIEFDIIAGVATAGIPWASFLAQKLNKPMVFVRPQAKEHGKGKQIEGEMKSGDRVLVVEDLISTGKSSLLAIKALREENAIISKIISIFNYNLTLSKENFSKNEVSYLSLLNFKDMIESDFFTTEQKVKLNSFWERLNT